jgi:aerobic carbon-monoxide dehydrogenase large subunit
VALTTDKVIEKGKKIAAHLMEASVEDVAFEDGTFKVAGTDKSVGWVQMTLAAHVPAIPARSDGALHRGDDLLRPAELHLPQRLFICEVEIDPDTGRVTVDRLLGVHDVGAPSTR